MKNAPDSEKMNIRYTYILNILYIVKRRYKQNLLETFYIATNSFTLSLDSDHQTIGSIMKNF